MLDPALTRPGRLSRRVVVPLPDERGRADILAVHLRSIPMAPELDRGSACRALAKITGGFSGAELANVINEAALLAGRKEAEVRSLFSLLPCCSPNYFPSLKLFWSLPAVFYLLLLMRNLARLHYSEYFRFLGLRSELF